MSAKCGVTIPLEKVNNVRVYGVAGATTHNNAGIDSTLTVTDDKMPLMAGVLSVDGEKSEEMVVVGKMTNPKPEW